jgi:hypothetical protein
MAAATRRQARKPREAKPPAPRPDDIATHPDPCSCPRCRGFEKCYACGRIKLDVDWCWAERRLVL